MLYDPRREKYPTLFRFIAWLRTLPADGVYDWQDPKKCVCGQFGWGDAYDSKLIEGVNLNMIAAGAPRGIIHKELWTFGQCLERAERVLGELKG